MEKSDDNVKVVISGDVRDGMNCLLLKQSHEIIENKENVDIIYNAAHAIEEEYAPSDVVIDELEALHAADLAVVACNDESVGAMAGLILGICWKNGTPALVLMSGQSSMYNVFWYPAEEVVTSFDELESLNLSRYVN